MSVVKKLGQSDDPMVRLAATVEAASSFDLLLWFGTASAALVLGVWVMLGGCGAISRAQTVAALWPLALLWLLALLVKGENTRKQKLDALRWLRAARIIDAEGPPDA